MKAPMIDFEFELLPVKSIQPWGDTSEGTAHLSWYALSYGCYRVRAGSTYLLEYADQPMREVTRTLMPEGKRAWVDHQVARLWDDVLTMLPFVMEPAPKEVVGLLETCDLNRIAAFSRQFDRWLLDEPPAQEGRSRQHELAELAHDWIGAVSLFTAYLSPVPAIWSWSTEATVTIAWDNRGMEFEGRPAWSAQRGFHHSDKDEFLAAVGTFSDRFLVEMAQRVEAICRNWDRPDVAVDPDMLVHEQQHRTEWAQQMLSLPPALTPDWDRIAAAIREITHP